MLHVVSVLFFVAMGLVACWTMVLTIAADGEAMLRALRREPMRGFAPAPLPPRYRMRTLPTRPLTAQSPLRAAA